MIGIFDSGVGGLSVQALIEAEMADRSTLYLADHAFAPYGDRSRAQLIERTTHIAAYLVDAGVRLVVVACNTATVTAIVELRRRFPEVTFVGMEPAVKPAAEAVSRIIVLGTRNTVTNERYRMLCERHRDSRTFWHVPAPELVAQVERGDFEDPTALRTLMGQAVSDGAEGVVIGCTHFSFLTGTIHRLWPHLQIFDGRRGTVNRVKTLLPPGTVESATHHFLTTGPSRNVHLPDRQLELRTVDL